VKLGLSQVEAGMVLRMADDASAFMCVRVCRDVCFFEGPSERGRGLQATAGGNGRGSWHLWMFWPTRCTGTQRRGRVETTLRCARSRVLGRTCWGRIGLSELWGCQHRIQSHPFRTRQQCATATALSRARTSTLSVAKHPMARVIAPFPWNHPKHVSPPELGLPP
jgi:hypothetical protein